LTDCDQTYTIGCGRCHVAVADPADRSLYRRDPGGGSLVLDSIVPRQPCIEIGSHVDRAGAGSGPPDYSAIWRVRHLADASPDRFTGNSLGAYPEPLILHARLLRNLWPSGYTNKSPGRARSATLQMKRLRRKVGSRSKKPDHLSAQVDRRRPGFSRELSVLYEDDAVVVLDKPAGLPAVPIDGSDAPSALSLLSAKLALKRQRAFVVHRIDRFTSGVLLFAKTESDRNTLVQQFLRHTPMRQYLAVVRGHLGAEEGTLVHYFRREGMFQKLRKEGDAKAARAELRYSVERLLLGASLVRVGLVTGLQNQIRAQFSAIGHPVIGDRKYHFKESSERLICRVALHATRLQFVHPRSGKNFSIDREPPTDFQYLVQRLSLPAPARS
jgi:23S rRNA pseudouridine1911/1915/1917 synthase